MARVFPKSEYAVPKAVQLLTWLYPSLPRQVSVSLETILVALIFLAALVTRLWNLGARVMSHDESLHVFYSWQLATGRGYAHNPMMHGPALFELTALVNLLFGANDFTSRLVSVILGIFLVVVIPRLLRPWLGVYGALAAPGLLLVSPYVLYYSRYIRHDIQVIAWLLLAVVAILRYLSARNDKDLLWLAAALGLMLSTMEIAFMYLAILAGFLLLRMLSAYGFRLSNLRRSAEFDLLVVLSTLAAFFSSPIALFFLNPLWSRLTGAPFLDLKVLGSQTFAWLTNADAVRVWSLFAAFALSAAAIGLWWGGRRWLKLAAVFSIIVVPLYTTFFTNPAGLGTGLVGSLGYWVAQQGVARGGQPGYYYLIVFPLYEYLPLLVGLITAAYFALRRKMFAPEERLFVSLTIFWAAGIWLALSIAGEKMPWLSTHIAVPAVLLSGWGIGKLLAARWSLGSSLHARLSRAARLAAGAVLVLLIAATLRTSFQASYVNYDYTTEYIGYAHGAPGVKWALDDLAKVAQISGAGKDLAVAYDSQVSWPMSWYLRDYPNQVFYGAQPNRAALEVPVVFAGPENWQKVESLLGNRYQRYEVIRVWWPLEGYKNLSFDHIRSLTTSPDRRAALWRIIWQRDYTRYAGLTGQAIAPPRDWPLSSRMRVYIRADLAAQLPDPRLAPYAMAPLPEFVDAYAEKQTQMTPKQVAAAGKLAPRGLAVAPDGSIYVADAGNNRIVRIDPDGNEGLSWGSRTPEGQESPPPGTFNEPWGVAVDPQGNIYVADTWNHRIQKFTPDGAFLTEWGMAGLSWEGTNRMWGPRAVAVGADGRVYVADTGNKRVVIYAPNGIMLHEFGTSGEGQLDEPVGLAIGPSGNVYIADTWNRRVAIFSPDGEFIQSWSVQGWESLPLDNKPYLSVDHQERVYITDPEGYRVVVFSASGEPLIAFGNYGLEDDAFGLPIGVAAAHDGTLWVADTANQRVVNYQLKD